MTKWMKAKNGRGARYHKMIPLASTQTKPDKKDTNTLYLRDEFKFDFFTNGLSESDAKKLGEMIVSFCAERDAVAGGNTHGVLYRNGRRVK
jgi:hypothetical protein